MFRLSTLRENRLQAFGLSRYAASTPLAGTRGHVISPPRVSRCPSPQRILGSGQSRVFEQARARAHKHFVLLVTHKVQPRVDWCRRLHTQVRASRQHPNTEPVAMMNKCQKDRAPASSHLQPGRHSLRSLVGCRHPTAGRSWCSDTKTVLSPSNLATTPGSSVQDRQRLTASQAGESILVAHLRCTRASVFSPLDSGLAFGLDSASTTPSTLATQSSVTPAWSTSTVPPPPASSSASLHPTMRPTSTMRPHSTPAEQNSHYPGSTRQVSARSLSSGISHGPPSMFRPCAGIFPASRCFFLPSHFLVSRGRLAVCFLEDAAVPPRQPQHPPHHRRLLFHFLRTLGSVLIGGHCLGLCIFTPPSSPFPPLVDAWQCAHWRTLPYASHHRTHSSHLPPTVDSDFLGRRCLHLHLTDTFPIGEATAEPLG